MRRRLGLLLAVDDSDAERRIEKQQAVVEACRRDVVLFCNDWAWCYEPRNVPLDLPALIPFDLWDRQVDYLRWLEARLVAGEEFVVEKSRDLGLTTLNAALALHRWLFVDGFKTGFGSRVEDDVDRLHDPDTIFEKIRLILRRLPPWMLPADFEAYEHDLYMRLINPSNGNVITGESGQNMGRGGRSSLYIVDEAAHIKHGETIDAAITANSECRGWVSSVYGMGNIFAKKRHSGLHPVFTFHFRDDPRRSAEWWEEKRAKTDATIFASEYDIDYSASVEGICIPGRWVDAAVQLWDRGFDPGGERVAGLDVGGGKALNVFINRVGPRYSAPEEWQEGDTINTAHKAIGLARERGVLSLFFDPVGVGAGVTAVMVREDRDRLACVGVNVGETPTDAVWPDGRTSKQMFTNKKGELWWKARQRFQATYQHVVEGLACELDDLIAIPNHPTLRSQLSSVRYFRTEKGKIVIETKAQLSTRGISSPDFAEAFMLAQADPVQENWDNALMGTGGHHLAAENCPM